MVKTTSRRVKYLLIILLACIILSVVFILYMWGDNEKFPLFGKTDKKVQQGEPVVVVNQSEKKNGYIITAKKVIKDMDSIGILLQVTGENCYNKLAIFSEVKAKVDGLSGNLNCKLRPVTCKEDGNYYILSIYTDKDINHKDITLQFKDYGYSDPLSKDFVMIQKGEWKLGWNLVYKNNTTTIAVNKNIKLYGGYAKFDKVAISPMSIVVDYSQARSFDIYKTEGVEANDRICIQFMNGKILNSTYINAKNFTYGNKRISINLDQVIDLADIESVTFADVAVQVHKNAHKLEVKEIVSNDMNLSIMIPKPVYDVLELPEYKEYYDETFNKDAKSLTFIGEKDGVSMTLFTITAIKADYTAKEVEALNPMVTYLRREGEYVYVLSYGEIVTQEQLNTFSRLLNMYIDNIQHRITIGIHNIAKRSVVKEALT